MEHRWREGESSPSGGLGVSGAAASGTNLGGDFEAVMRAEGANFSRIRKRSYKRAVRRAQLQGETMYRGRRLVSKSALLPVVEEPMVKKDKTRIRFLSWNVGGLSDVLFTELKQWLNDTTNREISIIILQETHWNFSGDWTTEDWHFCHTTSGKKGSGGILVGIRREFADPVHIRWHEAVPGRLLQVRCFLGQQQVDILGFYQHTLLQTAGETDKIFEQRRKLLANLDRLLASLPVRSHIVLGGDFNATLRTESKISGYGLLQRELSEKEKSDQDQLMRLLPRHGLTATNTWGSKRRAATYLHAKGKSQIDFVCVRQATADGTSKQAQPVMTNMAGWRTTGHLPLLGSLPLRWTPWNRSKQPERPATREGKGEEALRNLSYSAYPTTVAKLREAVLEAGGVLPTRIVRPELASVVDAVKGCWRLRHRLRVAQTLLGAGFIFVFRFFRLRLAYQKAHRTLKKALRDRKRQQTLTLLQQAETAAKKHDIRGMFGVVNILCPSKASQKIRLRDEEGNLMCGAEECKAMANYARTLFMAPEYQGPELLPIAPEELNLERWQQAAR